MKKEKKQRKKKEKKQRKKIPQNNPALAHKRHFRSDTENRLQMLLPKPEEEMFTTWCTLYTKLVPAAEPYILLKEKINS